MFSLGRSRKSHCDSWSSRCLSRFNPCTYLGTQVQQRSTCKILHDTDVLTGYGNMSPDMLSLHAHPGFSICDSRKLGATRDYSLRSKTISIAFCLVALICLCLLGTKHFHWPPISNLRGRSWGASPPIGTTNKYTNGRSARSKSQAKIPKQEAGPLETNGDTMGQG